MMPEWLLGAGTALWLGILTSISPCPLATNIVAISFVGRRVGAPAQVFFAGLLYTLGRSLTYLALGVLLVGSLLSVPQVSVVLQRLMTKSLGPLLVLVGMVLLDLLRVNLSGRGPSARLQKRVEGWGVWGALLLGVVFALSFCPLSAALFFGSLIPLAIRNGSRVLLPSLYGVGTALPVFAFALVIALGARSLATFFHRLTQVERVARWATGAVFVGAGIYLSVVYIFLAPA